MDKLEKLKQIFKEIGSCLVAYSGGADSTFLLKVAQDILGDKVLAVTAVSATYPKEELLFSKKMALSLGARHKIIRTDELRDKRFIANPPDRCYFCKKELFVKLKKIAASQKLNWVIDASNVSDKKDFRPGARAKKELGVRSPLQEAGISKNEVRIFSKKLNLSSWDKPSLACLASRVAYLTKISAPVLSRIDKAEIFLRGQGFKQVRLRHYGALCRIEAQEQDILALIKKRVVIIRKLKNLGYNYITVDLEGYRTGSMNEEIKRG